MSFATVAARLSKAGAAVGGVALVVMILLITAQVISRRILAAPMVVADELSGYLLVITTFSVLGGFANFFGPLVGAFSYVFLKSELMSLTDYWRFVLGAILVLIVVLFPRGVIGVMQSALAKARRA